MSHHVHTTPAYILSSRDIGEASKILTLFSRDHGVIEGIAQGVRFNKSKLRYALPEFSRPLVSLVRGREYWRIVGAVYHPREEVAPPPGEALTLYVRVLALIRQLAPLEAENQELFIEIEQAFRHLRALSVPEELKNFEAILVLRVLKNLGYIGERAALSKFMDSFVWSSGILGEISDVREEAIRAINESLAATQLV